MNTNGQDFINSLCRRLRDQCKLCTDSQILTLLRSLDRYEVNQIITFGDTDKWKRERIAKAELEAEQEVSND